MLDFFVDAPKNRRMCLMELISKINLTGSGLVDGEYFGEGDFATLQHMEFVGDRIETAIKFDHGRVILKSGEFRPCLYGPAY